jgi:hypothetical protein
LPQIGKINNPQKIYDKKQLYLKNWKRENFICKLKSIMYIDNNHSIILNLITISLFLFPLLRTSFTRKLFENLNLKNLIIVLNKTLVFQIIIGILLTIISFLIDKLIYTNGDGNFVSALFIESTYYYIVIGLFIYLPLVCAMNIMNWVAKKINL